MHARAPVEFREHRVVPGISVGGARLSGAVGRIPVHLQPSALLGGNTAVGVLDARVHDRANRRGRLLTRSGGAGRIRLSRSMISGSGVGGFGIGGCDRVCAIAVGAGLVVAVAAIIFSPTAASLPSSPDALVSSQSVISPVPGSALTCPRNPSRRADFDLRVWRASGSTVEITRSGATRRAMRHRPSVPSEPCAGSTSWSATRASSPSASAAAFSHSGASPPVSSASTASASLTRSDTRFCLACGSSQSMSGLPGFE